MRHASIVRSSPLALLIAAGAAHAQCDPVRMIASDPQNGAGGGASVAIDGQFILSGSPAKDTVWGTTAGEVYCYTPVNGVWSQVGHIIPGTLGEVNAGFGHAVGVGGGGMYAVVGSPYSVGWGGLSYIFQRDPQTNVWTQKAAINPLYGGSARFGLEVAMNTAGDIALMSAPYATVTDAAGTTSSGGRVLLYVRNPDGTWSSQMDLHQYTGSKRHDADFYGMGVGVDGTTAVVGCRDGWSATHAGCGYIHIWDRNAANIWTNGGEIYAPDEATNGFFGESVAINGNTIVVGADGATHQGLVNAGAAYVYRKVNGVWQFDAILHASDPAASDAFGSRVSVHGDEVAVASWTKMYIFRRVGAGQWVQDARCQNPGQVGDMYAQQIAVGNGKVATGAWGFDPPGLTDMGCTYIYDFPSVGSDSCEGATPIAAGTVTGCTTNCSVDGGSTCGEGSPIGPDIWFRYTAPATGPVVIDTQGSTLDTVLSVHNGCPGTIANTVQCNDDFAAPQRWSKVTVNVSAGQSYLIRIAGYGGSVGNFVLNVGQVGGCYANCDNSTTSPVLNVLDFSCFLNKFAAGDPYANCDNSTTAPVLNVLDFSCFLNKFAAGCS
jgi:hypothetical protein